MSALRSFFTERRPWAAVIVALLFGPFLGTLYLGRGGWSLFYLALELLTFAAPFGLAYAGLFTADPVFTWDVLHFMWLFAGAGHGYVLAANKQASHPKVLYAGWCGLAGIYIVFILSVELVRWFGYAPYKIPDTAMGPGLKAGDYVLVARGFYGYSHHSFPFPVPAIRGRVFAAPPEKGDIVVFKATKDADGVLIRRITGLPGERVRLAHGRDETAPKGHYFVLGDHQNSRPGSLIPEENLIGRVTHILWNGRQRKFRPASVR